MYAIQAITDGKIARLRKMVDESFGVSPAAK